MGDVKCKHAVRVTNAGAVLGGGALVSNEVECRVLRQMPEANRNLLLMDLYTKDPKLGFDAMTGTACPFAFESSTRKWQDCPILKKVP
jgi:hypothetical protein